MNTIFIFKNNEITPCFVKANHFLYEKFKVEFEEASNKDNLLINLWESTFNATLKKSNEGVFDEIMFKNEKDLALFMFRFS